MEDFKTNLDFLRQNFFHRIASRATYSVQGVTSKMPSPHILKIFRILIRKKWHFCFTFQELHNVYQIIDYFIELNSQIWLIQVANYKASSQVLILNLRKQISNFEQSMFFLISGFHSDTLYRQLSCQPVAQIDTSLPLDRQE